MEYYTFTILLFSAISLSGQQSQMYMDYFMMTEATIMESRITEDLQNKYEPFYMICHRETCDKALPRLNPKDGRLVIPCPNDDSCDVYFGCPQFRDDKDILEYETYKNLVVMQSAEKIHDENPSDSTFEYYVDIHSYSCNAEIIPVIERTTQRKDALRVSYRIGFDIFRFGQVWMVEVLYKIRGMVPVYTKHTIHGKSLTAAPTLIPPRQEYLTSPDINLANALKNYDNTKSSLQPLLMKAQLIPDYDMVHASWRRLPHYFHTIAPMMKTIYEIEWLDIEYAIRNAAFLLQKDLIVYTGIYGKLTQDNAQVNKENIRRYQMFVGENYRIPVPQAFWKVVVDEDEEDPRAIAILVENLTDDLFQSQIYTSLPPTCNEPCADSNWTQIQSYFKVYCCSIEDLIDMIPELETHANLRKSKYRTLFFP